MVIPMVIPMPTASGGGGYSGEEVSTDALDLPTLPKGWRWVVKDNGDEGLLSLPPITIWLYGPHSIVHQHMEWCYRSKWRIRRKARKTLRIAKQKGRMYGGDWADFLKED